METRMVRSRVANACDTCKIRKIKCSGRPPCGYCVRRREPESCRFTAGRRRTTTRLTTTETTVPRQQQQDDDGSLSSSIVSSQNVAVASSPARSGSGSISVSAGVVAGGTQLHHAPLPPPPPPPQHPHLHEPHPHHHNHLITSTTPTTTNISTIPTNAAAAAETSDGNRDNAEASRQQVPSSPAAYGEHEHEETEVPREARLLLDAQGKLIFIGDCAPLSFFQTVRRLVISRVDPHALLPESGGYSALENNNYSSSSMTSSSSSARPGIPPNFDSRGGNGGSNAGPKVPKKEDVERIVRAYLEGTAGVVDLFGDDAERLVDEMNAWIEGMYSCSEAAAAVGTGEEVANYLVLAIGCQNLDSGQDENNGMAKAYFDYARDVAFSSLNHGMGDLGVASVQSFILITLYSLGACQINSAFIFFGIAARAAHSIGIHRTAVNARFGEEVGMRRDKLWKSLRVVDLYLSTSMGRPPATSDVDCTVPYRGVQDEERGGEEKFDLLNASVQIFLVIESIVVEVYSRRKISPKLTEGISRELRDWSAKWLQRLKDVVEGSSTESRQPGAANGACQVLASYYYAVVLVSRPFLMVELHRRLADDFTGNGGDGSGKAKLADACIDASILMVETIRTLIDRGSMTRRAPMVVSWLFAASLVLGVGLLGGFGRIIEKHCRASIAALEYFAQADAHAVQYSLIAKSLLATALEHLEKREMQERLRRTESSSRIFGLIPRETRQSRSQATASGVEDATKGLNQGDKSHLPRSEGPTPGFGFDFESAFMGLTDSAFTRTPDFSIMMGGGSFVGEAENTFGALNLFPLLEGDGHIDLANYF